MQDARPTLAATALAALLAVAGADVLAGTEDARPALTIAQRTLAAEKTAQDDAACVAVRPFYWEIGDASGTLAQGRVGLRAPGPDTRLPIASASKLVYGAYVVQKHGGRLSAEDVRDLTFVSGYTDFERCRRGQTVGECQAWRQNGDHERENDGKFYYNGGHMQKHAVVDGEGADDAAELARHVNAMLGTDFGYGSPQLAGGIDATPAVYGRFLQRIVAGDLLMHDALGTHAVCTNPATCSTAVFTPMPHTESPHYSIGHWVEDDPQAGDGAFSSAGAFGFYPWIDRHVKWWGVLARMDLRAGAQPGPGVESLYCGRRIRAAWVSGQ
jgi:hypothetical protein